MFRKTQVLTILLVVGLLAVAGCARSPEAQKIRHLARGDKYAAQEQYREAILEYKNVLRVDPVQERAIRQLGLSYYHLGELTQAFRYLLQAEEMTPGALDVRLRLGTIYFLRGNQDEATREVSFVLEREPKNLDGLALLASLAATPEDVDTAIRRLETAQTDLGDRASLHQALGVLYLKKKDGTRAERAFREAVARDPTFAEAHVALGLVYLGRRDGAEAEREFNAAAVIAPVGSSARMQLADFYLLVQKPVEAKRVLSEITRKAPDFLPAWRRLAEISFHEGALDESLNVLQALLKRSPSDVEGRLLLGRGRLAKGENNEAIQEFQQVLKVDPRNAPARYQLAVAHLQAGNLQQAKAELKVATSVAPNFTEAVLVLAELNIQTGAVELAIEDLQRFLARRPSVFQAHRLLGLAYLAKHEPARATEAFRKLPTLAPKDPRGFLLVGNGLRAQGKFAEARTEFEAAIARMPGYVEPLAQLAAMALAEKQPDAALKRVTKQAALVPTSGEIQHLLGMVHLARREPALAERAFLRAVELEPTHSDSYIRLGDLYAVSGRYDEAMTELNEALKVNPRSLPAQMLLGMLYERKGETAKAQQAYEKVLTLNPRFVPAANNLAWLYSERDADKDKALQVAQTAKEMAPEDPTVSDTLGWILYNRGSYQRAVSLFKESARKLPNQPIVQYHLGLGSLKIGDKDGARAALVAAVSSPASFPGKDEARKALAELK